MKLSWTFYPKGAFESVTLEIIYVPELDAESLPSGGFLVVPTNTAYVDWTTYKRFDTADVASRKDAFKRLIPITKRADVQEVTGNRLRFPQP